MPINYVQTSGKEIADLVESIEELVEGVSNIQVSVACIVVAALAQNPSVSADKLQEIVKGVSEYMATTLFDESEMGSIN